MTHTLLDTIGNTPLIRLQRMVPPHAAEVWVKLENRNPGGSVKDRIALYMLEKAIERGLLAPGCTVVEPTSGNTGIGLALVAAIKGVRCILTMPESMSVERRTLIASLGAEAVLTPAALGMAGAVEKAQTLAREYNAFLPQQFSNPDVVEAHYIHTGPEIFAAAGDSIGAFVAGIGTGGTFTGAGRYLRERIPHIALYAVEPAASPLLTKGQAGAHPLQGIGANFIPTILDTHLIDEVIDVPNEAAFATARRLYREEGIMCGISSGANVWAALQVARNPAMQGKRVVTIICDTGERYLSTPLFTGGD